MKWIKIKITAKTDIRGNKPGSIIRIKADKFGSPIDQYWRNRISDSNIDHCVQIIPCKIPTEEVLDEVHTDVEEVSDEVPTDVKEVSDEVPTDVKEVSDEV